MKLFLGVLVPLLAVMSAGTSLVMMRADAALSHYEALRKSIEAEGADDASTLPQQMYAQQEKEALQAAADKPLRSPEAAVLFSNWLREAAAEERNGDTQIALYCRSMSLLATALEVEPFNSRYLINIANTRQLLGDYACPDSRTDFDFQPAAALAVERDPFNRSVLYGAGALAVWSGKSGAAKKFFHQLLRYSPLLSEGQQHFILAQLRTAQDFAAVVPPRFPQVNHWSGMFRAAQPRAFSQGREQIAAMQIAALREGIREFQNRLVPPQLHLRRLLGLLPHAAMPAVRREVDKLIAEFFSDMRLDVDAQKYFAERAELEEVSVVRSFIAVDSRPLKSPFFRWEGNAKVSLDDNFASLGFYMREGQAARLIELRSETAQPAELKSFLHVYVSEDNEHWRELQKEIAVSDFEVGDSRVFVIRIPRSADKYWKIHFASSKQDRIFTSKLTEMLRVFGASPYDR